MSNKTIGDYSAANSIDASADYFLIDPAGSGNYKKINRNVTLGITSGPLGTTDTQSPTNKTFDNTNTITVKDGSFTLQKTGATTKQAVFELTNITGGTTRTVTLPDSNTTIPISSQILTIAGPTNARTYTFPDANTTIAGIATAQTLTNKTITDSTNVLGGVTMTLGSDATGDIYYRTGGVLTRLPIGTAGQVLTTNGGATAPAWGSSSSQMILLKANSGTDTNAGATNVDTYAISGLTAKDTLVVYHSFQCATQKVTAPVSLYQSTSGANLVSYNAGADLDVGYAYNGSATIRQGQVANTTYYATVSDAGTIPGGQAGGTVRFGGQTGLTAWTGSWTLALRHGGVVAGGTFYWSWAIYKVAGQ